MKKKIFFIFGIIILIVIGIFLFFLFNKSSQTGTIIQNIEIIPLTSEQKQKFAQAVLSSEFIEDIPEKYPLVITFFSFEDGKRIWYDSFLIGKKGFLSEGQPEIYLSLHSKYISELNEDNICEVVGRANKNGDIGFYTQSSKASLLIKYAGMLKHRECFGF